MARTKRAFLAFVLLFWSFSSSAQDVTYITDVTGDIYEVDIVTCTSTLISTGNFFFTDIAYNSQNDTIYCLNEFGGMYVVNASIGGPTVYIGAVNSFANFTGMVGMTCDMNGLLYITAYNVSYVGGYIYSYDAATNTTTNIGSLPSFVEPAGDLTYYNGQMVVSTMNNEIYAVDLTAPSFSTLLYTYQGTIDAFGITSVNCGQDLLLSSGNQLFLLDNTTSLATPICTFASVVIEINGASSTGELPMDLDLGQDTSICGTFSLTLDAQNVGSTYNWNDGSTGQTLQVTGPGTYWVEVVNSACSSSDTIIVSPLPGPLVDLGNDTTLCAGNSILLDAQNAGSSYLWNDNSTNQTLLVNLPGVYSVSVASNNCTTVDSISVSFESNPLDLGPDGSICSPITLNAGNGGQAYLWNDGSTSSTLLADSVGTYWVELSTAICMYNDTIELTLGAIETLLPSDTTLCQNNGNLVLDAQNPGANYLWQDGSFNQIYTVNTEGVYWVTVSLDWCETTDTINVAISNPLADFQVTDTIGCDPLLTYFLDQSVSLLDPIVSWNWNFGDGTSSSIQNPTHSYSSSGIYGVTLTVTTAGGCMHAYSRNLEIIIYPQPQAEFTYIPVEPQLGETIYFTDESSQVFSWYWGFGNGNSSDLQDPEQIYDTEGSYVVTLIITDIRGCSDSVERVIQLNNDIIFYVPNSFTPNGDEYNSIFQVVIGSKIDETDFHLQIYSRWGELVYESFDHQVGWDGTYKGKIVQDGVYTWILSLDKEENAERKVIRGHVNVIR